MQTTLKFQSLAFSNTKTYLAATLFIMCNILMPQFFHLVPQGGVTWLPIYFFTLTGSYLYGWRVGLLTAFASPVINCLLFGMPAVSVLPAIIVKSVLLAVIAGYAAWHFNKVTMGLLMLVVLGYQSLGTIGEWLLTGDFRLACQDFRIGIPGMLLQMIGGYWVIKFLMKKI